MKARRLAQTLYELASGDDSKARVDAFFSYLKEKGYLKLLPLILTEYNILASATSAKDQTIIRVVKNISPADAKALAKKHDVSDDVEVIIDENVVGGYIVETPSTYTDVSHKHALLKLYQSLTR